MRVLALDLGTTTGWATYVGYPPPRYKLSSWKWGTWELQELWEEYRCGCVSDTVPRKEDLLGYCPKHGDNRRRMHKEGLGEIGLRFKRFMLQLTPVLERWKPDLVAFEDPGGHFKGAGGYVITGQRGIVMALCELHVVPYTAVNTNTWRKACLGKGNFGSTKANKAEAHRQLLERWEECFIGSDWLPEEHSITHNEVDALWVGYYAVQNYTGERDGQE